MPHSILNSYARFLILQQAKELERTARDDDENAGSCAAPDMISSNADVDAIGLDVGADVGMAVYSAVESMAHTLGAALGAVASAAAGTLRSTHMSESTHNLNDAEAGTSGEPSSSSSDERLHDVHLAAMEALINLGCLHRNKHRIVQTGVLRELVK